MGLFKNKYGMVRAGWVLVFACLFFLFMNVVFSLPGLFLYKSIQTNENNTHFSIELDNKPWLELLMNGGGVVGAIIATLLLWKFINKKALMDVGLKINTTTMKDFIFGLLLGALSMTVIFVVLLFGGHVHLENSLLTPTISIYSLTFLLLFLFVGFSEEIFFRGYLMKTMTERYNPKWLVYIISAVIFSLFHGMNPNVTLFGLINIALVGLLFSYMFDITKSLWMPIGYHITWNYFQGNVFGFPVSGTDPHGFYKLTLESHSAELFTGGSFGPEGGVLATILIIVGFISTHLYNKAKVHH